MMIKRLLQAQNARSTLQSWRFQRRFSSENATQRPRSGHAQWYADVVPAMIPIFLLGSAVYLGLQLVQQKLSHEKFMDESLARVRALEAEVDSLQGRRAEQVQLPAWVYAKTYNVIGN